MGNFTNKIVIKPWGYEYLVYENENVALWCLHINQGESTSMHCHPKKTTGLILLNGEAEVSFLSDRRVIKGLDKVMIRRGLFHQTKALSEGGVDIFEIETPNDKEDLVRLMDNYGRENKSYETTYRKKDKSCLNIKLYKKYGQQYFSFLDLGITVVSLGEANVSRFNGLDDNSIVVFLKGGLKRTVKDKSLCALIPGDVGFGKIVKLVANELDGFMKDTIVMIINKKVRYD